MFNRNLENNDIINNVLDDIILNETQKVSSLTEAPELLDSDCDKKDLYPVDIMILEETKEKIE